MNSFALIEIEKRLEENDFPFEGQTELGSAYFMFMRPANYFGIAIHAGSKVRPDLLKKMKISREDRFREEDPFTQLFIMDFHLRKF